MPGQQGGERHERGDGDEAPPALVLGRRQPPIQMSGPAQRGQQEAAEEQPPGPWPRAGSRRWAPNQKAWRLRHRRAGGAGRPCRARGNGWRDCHPAGRPARPYQYGGRISGWRPGRGGTAARSSRSGRGGVRTRRSRDSARSAALAGVLAPGSLRSPPGPPSPAPGNRHWWFRRCGAARYAPRRGSAPTFGDIARGGNNSRPNRRWHGDKLDGQRAVEFGPGGSPPAERVDIQALLGHSTINTTQIYSHVGQDRMEQVVARL